MPRPKKSKVSAVIELKSFPAEKPKRTPRWWERNDCRLRVMEEHDMGLEAVQVVRTHLQYPIVIGTIAVVTVGGDDQDAIMPKNGLAARIAANPDILDTLNDPNVLDCREWYAQRESGFSDESIDAFAEKTCKSLELLGIEHSLSEDQELIVTLPDGSNRTCYGVHNDNGGGALFLGRKVSRDIAVAVA